MAKRKTPDGDVFEAKEPAIKFEKTDAIRADVLECFDYQYKGREIEIATETDEFTFVCPFSGLPDFGHLTITYIPGKKCVELRSLKYYLTSFRNVGIFYEHVCNRILDDLVALMDPKWIEVVCAMTIRGGLNTTVRAEHLRAARSRGGKKS
jgi:7-cyano-7-deazaguanine reductase